jgi:signal transduction histidine kinase
MSPAPTSTDGSLDAEARARQAERQRDEALRFLSHDARTGDSVILGMIELARAKPGAFADGRLLHCIEEEARAGLERCDTFVRLARAETQALRLETIDLPALLRQAIDFAWSRARERRLRVRLADPPAEARCRADRGLLACAFESLLADALRQAQPGSDVDCRLTDDAALQQWQIALCDRRPAPAAQAETQALRLARVVLARHCGTVAIAASDAGRCVTLQLPKA